ncbi:MAG: hypothetical protein Q6373_008615 [Candidatus Sigynarchaeota archaeon]
MSSSETPVDVPPAVGRKIGIAIAITAIAVVAIIIVLIFITGGFFAPAVGGG